MNQRWVYSPIPNEDVPLPGLTVAQPKEVERKASPVVEPVMADLMDTPVKRKPGRPAKAKVVEDGQL